jgi:hypothetical protein
MQIDGFKTAFPYTPVDNAFIRSNGASPFVTDAIRCTGAGNVNVRMEDGKDAIIPFEAGESQRICCTMVHSTNTTATGITVYKY